MKRLAFALALAVAAASGRAAADPKLVVAIYAPNAPFESGDARFSFANRLAQQIQSATGLGVEPKAFARAADFEAAITKEAVDYAVVDGIYLAERGVPFPVIATATVGGELSTRWSLFSAIPGGVFELEGKKLALAATGSKDTQFIDNALLDGELLRHFGARQTSPDVVSAVTAVSLKKADCVFAPSFAGRGLRSVFDAGRVPNPAFVQVRSTVAADVSEKVKKAVLGDTSSGTYNGWRAGGAEALKAFGARMTAKLRRPVMAEPAAVPVAAAEALAPARLDPAVLDLRDQFWSPTGAP